MRVGIGMGVSTSRLDLSGDAELMKVKMKLRIATESRAETGVRVAEWSFRSGLSSARGEDGRLF